MKILITGASGFIGHHIVKDRLFRNDELFAVTRKSTDISLIPGDCRIFCYDDNLSELDYFFKQEKIDGIIHLATKTLVLHKTEDIKSLIDSNVLFGATLIDLASKNNVKWFINTTTFMQHYDNKDYFAANLYSATKQAFQDIAKFYADTTNIIVTNLSLFDTFGTNDTRKKIISILYEAAKNGNELAMSPGEQIIDISHIDNIVHGFNILIGHLSSSNAMNFNGETFALPSNDRLKLKDLVTLFSEVYGNPVNVCFGKREYRPFEVMVPWDNCKILPGWSPVIGLREGIIKFLKESAF